METETGLHIVPGCNLHTDTAHSLCCSTGHPGTTPLMFGITHRQKKASVWTSYTENCVYYLPPNLTHFISHIFSLVEKKLIIQGT